MGMYDPEAHKRAFENFTPRANPPKAAETAKSSAAPVDIDNPEELRKLAKSKLVEIIQNSAINVSLVAAIRELLDRVDGKPAQSINLDAEVRQVTVNAMISFAELQPHVDNLIIDHVDK